MSSFDFFSSLSKKLAVEEVPYQTGHQGNKIRYRNVHLQCTSLILTEKSGYYIATKLFQFASREEPYSILAGPDGFFPLRTALIQGFPQ